MARGSQPPASPGAGLRLVVVDDSEDSRSLVVFFLARAFDADIRTARNGAEAVDLLRRQGADLVFLDLEMPLMDGYTAARMLKADPQTASIPLIAMTAHTAEEEIERALAAGCAGYVAKPFTRDVLAQAVLRHASAASAASVTYLPAATAGPGAANALRGSYVDSRRRDAVEIPALLEAGDLSRIARLGALMERTGDDYGLSAVAALGARLRKAAGSGDREGILRTARDLERVLPEPKDPG